MGLQRGRRFAAGHDGSHLPAPRQKQVQLDQTPLASALGAHAPTAGMRGRGKILGTETRTVAKAQLPLHQQTRGPLGGS